MDKSSSIIEKKIKIINKTDFLTADKLTLSSIIPTKNIKVGIIKKLKYFLFPFKNLSL